MKHDNAKNELIRDLNIQIEAETGLLQTDTDGLKSLEDSLDAIIHSIKNRQEKIASIQALKAHLEQFGRGSSE